MSRSPRLSLVTLLLPATAGAAPAGISNDLELWLSATTVTDSSDIVTEWTDLSGNSRHATSTINNGPTLNSSALNGQPTLSFDGNSLEFDGSFLINTDYTIFVVSGRDGSNVGNFYFGGTDSSRDSSLILGYENTTTLRLSHYGNDLDGSVTAWSGTQIWSLDTFSLDTTVGRTIWQDGGELASDTNTSTLTSFANASVGHFSRYWYKGDLAEVVVYDRVLSCSERIQVEDELATLYGLVVDHSDVDSNGDLVCDSEDADSDGIADSEDCCPTEYADSSNDIDGNGCPDEDLDGTSTVTFDCQTDGSAIALDSTLGINSYSEDGVSYAPAIGGETYDGVFTDDGSGDISLRDTTNDGFGLPLYFAYEDGSSIVLESLEAHEAGTNGEITVKCVNDILGRTIEDISVSTSQSSPSTVTPSTLAGMACDAVIVDLIAWSGNDSDTRLSSVTFSRGAEDADGDGVSYQHDLCPTEDATGWDNDGDGCLDDTDDDGVTDDLDVCEGDDATGDTDSDEVCDDSDVCPTDADDLDEDEDLVCDVEDACLGDNSTGDTDGDQVCNDQDLCDGNDAVGDTDGDAVCDDIDNCPADANADQADTDGDELGDACETDTDSDGTDDDEDNCPDDFNEDQADLDSDGEGDACDADDDGDGTGDSVDNCPLTSNTSQTDTDSDGLGDACDGDDDADGVADADDLCSATPMGVLIDSSGCSGAQFVWLNLGEMSDYRSRGRYISRGARLSIRARRSGLLSSREFARTIRQIIHSAFQG